MTEYRITKTVKLEQFIIEYKENILNLHWYTITDDDDNSMYFGLQEAENYIHRLIKFGALPEHTYFSE